MGPHNQTIQVDTTKSDRHRYLSFVDMWDGDDDLPFRAYAVDEDERPIMIEIPGDNGDEHTFITMKRPTFLAQSHDLFGDEEEDDTETAESSQLAAASAARSRANRGSMASITFTHDEVYENDDGDSNDDDLLDLKRVKAAQDNLFHANVSNKAFYGFMILAAGLVVYMVFLMFEVEAEESDPVINFIVNQTKHTAHHRFSNVSAPPPGLAAMATKSRANSTWERVFQHHTQQPERQDGGNEASPPETKESRHSNGNETSDPKSTVQVDANGTQLVGFIDAPPKLEELVLLMGKGVETGGSGRYVDDSEHHEIVNDSGDTLHCGIKVDGKSVTLECSFGEELCRVYLGEGDCELSDQV